MSDYIDRQAALDAIQAEREYMTRREEWLAEHILTHCGYRIIEDLPAADVEPVRHGRWIYGTDEETGEQDIVAWTCSLCGEKTPWQPRYCMHCGARMDGDENADEITV